MMSKISAAGVALLLSVGAAAAAPATVSTDLNMRSGPGTQYGVVATIPAGATVDVGGCTGSWCQVNFDGTSGYASASYLSGGAAATPSVGVAVAPGYVYDDDYYDYGYTYGPSFGFYAGPRYRHGWRGHWQQRPGGWAGRPGGGPGGWAGRPGGPGGAAGAPPSGLRVGGAPPSGPRMGGGPERAPNVGSGARMSAPGATGPRVSAPAGMRSGGGAPPASPPR